MRCMNNDDDWSLTLTYIIQYYHIENDPSFNNWSFISWVVFYLNFTSIIGPWNEISLENDHQQRREFGTFVKEVITNFVEGGGPGSLATPGKNTNYILFTNKYLLLLYSLTRFKCEHPSDIAKQAKPIWTIRPTDSGFEHAVCTRTTE